MVSVANEYPLPKKTSLPFATLYWRVMIRAIWGQVCDYRHCKRESSDVLDQLISSRLLSTHVAIQVTHRLQFQRTHLG